MMFVKNLRILEREEEEIEIKKKTNLQNSLIYSLSVCVCVRAQKEMLVLHADTCTQSQISILTTETR